MKEEKTKSFPVSKRMVYNSYLKVISKKGSAGSDGQSIEMFKAKQSENLYKIYNRMASGSYFPPPVRTELIPKKQGGLRPLGIPTVADRIAQGVVKDYLEPVLDKKFHPSSYGYRPGKGAHDALARCQTNCINFAWVIDVDIKGFFDNINHEKMMELLRQHTSEKWVLLYVERWLKAAIQKEDGSLEARTKGTPQGGVISPLLSNLYLHAAFDSWMQLTNSNNPFERYADDIVIHCSSRQEALKLLSALECRLSEYSLTLHPEKTKIVYCKNYNRNELYDTVCFTFLGYSFQPRAIKDKFGRNKCLQVFNAAMSKNAMAFIRKSVRQILNPRWTDQTLDGFAKLLNPKIRGWISYYGLYYKWKITHVFDYLDKLIIKWLGNKYKITSKVKCVIRYKVLKTESPDLFYHWHLGIK